MMGPSWPWEGHVHDATLLPSQDTSAKLQCAVRISLDPMIHTLAAGAASQLAPPDRVRVHVRRVLARPSRKCVSVSASTVLPMALSLRIVVRGVPCGDGWCRQAGGAHRLLPWLARRGVGHINILLHLQICFSYTRFNLNHHFTHLYKQL